MKRILSVFLSLLFVLTVTACNGQAPANPPEETPSFAEPPTESQLPLESSFPELEESSDSTSEPAAVPEERERILIAYFSLSDIVPEGVDAISSATPSIGNTEAAALEIQRQVGGNLFAIHTVQAYPVSHRECSAIAEEEMRSDARPELATHLENMEDYDTVYIGYPIWWYVEPMAIRTFLEEYDFSGKTILPFCTSLGAGIKESEENIRSLCPDSTVLPGVTLPTEKDSLSEPITEWLAELNTTN